MSSAMSLMSSQVQPRSRPYWISSADGCQLLGITEPSFLMIQPHRIIVFFPWDIPVTAVLGDPFLQVGWFWALDFWLWRQLGSWLVIIRRSRFQPVMPPLPTIDPFQSIHPFKPISS